MINFWRSFFYAAIIGISAFFLGESLPRKWFSADRFPFRSWKWENNGKIYDRIRIKEWKDQVPDMSRMVKKMVPKRLGSCPSSADVELLIAETCVAETVHWILFFLSPPIYTFWHNGIGVFLTAVYAFGNLVFVLIQRYNRPALVSLAGRLKQREARRAARAKSQEAAAAEKSEA